MTLTILGLFLALTFGLTIAYITNPFWRRKVNHTIQVMRLGIKEFWDSRFSKTPAIKNFQTAICKLGDPRSEDGRDGIYLVDFKDDGSSVREIVDKEWVRRTDNRSENLYFYFALRGDFAEYFRSKPLLILVEYLDRNEGFDGSTKDDGKRGLYLLYDAIGDDHDSIFKKAGQIGFTEIDGVWKWAGFNVKDGFFKRRQQGIGDFRIGCRYPNLHRDYNLYLRRVMLVSI